MQCTAHRRKPTSPFGFKGSHRCPNEATARVSSYSAGDKRVGRFVVCPDHLGSGRLGMETPKGWRWVYEGAV